MNIILTVLLTVAVLELTALLVILLRIFQVFSRNYESFLDFLEPGDDGKSKAVTLLSHGVDYFASILSASIKASLMGTLSGISRQAKNIEGEIVQGVVQDTSPIAGVILDLFPSLKKKIIKNPGMMDLAIGMLSKASKKNSAPGNGTGAGDIKNTMQMEMKYGEK